jgi:hypothetical protein
MGAVPAVSVPIRQMKIPAAEFDRQAQSRGDEVDFGRRPTVPEFGRRVQLEQPGRVGQGPPSPPGLTPPLVFFD